MTPVLQQAVEERAWVLAQNFHAVYERLAPEFGYETRPETRGFVADSPNGRLMRAVCAELLRTGVIAHAAIQQQPEPVAWMDDKRQFHYTPRHHFLGLVDESCGSRDHIWSGTSLAEAGEAWKRFVAQGSKDIDLTGWGCGIIADHRLMKRHFAEAVGTFACPICGQETPHQHPAEVVAFHREDEKWEQEQHVKAWQQVEARVAVLGDRYPPRTPLYASPPSLQQQEVPSGWKLVPVEPTKEQK